MPSLDSTLDETRDGTSSLALIALLQLADSQFPSGGFAHSYGLEQLARERFITEPSGVEGFVRSVIVQQVATSDARAAAAAARAGARGDLEAVLAIDEALFVTKAASEARHASTSVGRRLLEELVVHDEVPSPVLGAFLDTVKRGETPGTHAVAFGLAGSALGVGAESISATLLFATASAMLSASMRLLPVSHRDVQRTLHRLRPLIAQLGAHAAEASALGAPVLQSFHPLQEIAAMRHATSAVRLFAS